MKRLSKKEKDEALQTILGALSGKFKGEISESEQWFLVKFPEKLSHAEDQMLGYLIYKYQKYIKQVAFQDDKENALLLFKPGQGRRIPRRYTK